MKHRIDERPHGLEIEINDVQGHKEKLLKAFQECREGRCSCPTEEYKKLEALEIEEGAEAIRLRLRAKRGKKVDQAEISRCLEYTADCVKKEGDA